LTASGLYDVIREHRVRYVDLNTDDVRPAPVKSSFTRFKELYLPDTLYNADLLVSMPKLKTHHWGGVTLALKNMFGVIPGAIYGWPKNALHWAGIDGMEGNGPLQGEARQAGVLVFGSDLVAVDATAARLMTIEPTRVQYLADAGKFLGNVELAAIEQIGETVESRRQDFRVLEKFNYLKKLIG